MFIHPTSIYLGISYSFIHSVSQSVMPSSVLGIVESLVSKMDKIPTLRKLGSLMERQTLNRYTCAYMIMNYAKCCAGAVQGALRGLVRET